MKSYVLVVVVLSLLVLSGCAGTMHAIQNREMSVSAKMSDTIFLDPEVVEKNKSVYVRFTNTSDFQEINFSDVLKKKLEARGCKLTEL
ncbi:MAG: complement resistance protein TraT [Nitrospiraceae bacterium]|nr:complement resistance protein TraT [Nitrospiraceae bacterium]